MELDEMAQKRIEGQKSLVRKQPEGRAPSNVDALAQFMKAIYNFEFCVPADGHRRSGDLSVRLVREEHIGSLISSYKIFTVLCDAKSSFPDLAEILNIKVESLKAKIWRYRKIQQEAKDAFDGMPYSVSVIAIVFGVSPSKLRCSNADISPVQAHISMTKLAEAVKQRDWLHRRWRLAA